MKMFIAIILLPLLTMAQDIPVVENADFLQQLLSSLGGLKGAGALAIAYFVVQLLLKLLGTPLFGSVTKKVAGHIKLTIYLVLSIPACILAAKMSGLDWGAAVMHSSTVTAIGIALNQIYKQYIEKKA